MTMNRLKSLPLIGPLTLRVKRWLDRRFFPGAGPYWERRYAKGGTSGPGSHGRLAAFKAEALNRLIKENDIQSVVEFGCGDGHQVSTIEYPRYIGLDVSPSAIASCRQRFASDPSKRFLIYDPEAFDEQPPEDVAADAAVSLDVIYHLVDDRSFELHMKHLFASARRYVVIYSSDTDDNPPMQPIHVRHRRFTRWVTRECPGWRLKTRIENPFPYDGDLQSGSHSDLFIYERMPSR